MFGATILILSLPIPIIISNFLRAHDMLTKDGSLENFYFDHNKSKEVEQTLLKGAPAAELMHHGKAEEKNGDLSMSSSDDDDADDDDDEGI